METIVGALGFFIVVVYAGVFTTSLKCRDIIDIYYPKDLANLAYESKCRYTRTEINCRDCAVFYVSRRFYKDWAKEYRDLGLNPPFPRRTDMDRIIDPRKK